MQLKALISGRCIKVKQNTASTGDPAADILGFITSETQISL